MHDKAKKRIAESKKIKPAKKIKISIPAGSDVFGNFIKSIDTLCDQAIASDKLNQQQKEKAVFIKSRLLIV